MVQKITESRQLYLNSDNELVWYKNLNVPFIDVTLNKGIVTAEEASQMNAKIFCIMLGD